MPKRQLDFLQAPSLRLLISQVNEYNDTHSEAPILKDDIVELLFREDVVILLYYK